MNELADVVQLRHKTVELPEEPSPGELEVPHMMSWEASHRNYDVPDLAGGEGRCMDQMKVGIGSERHGLLGLMGFRARTKRHRSKLSPSKAVGKVLTPDSWDQFCWAGRLVRSWTSALHAEDHRFESCSAHQPIPLGFSRRNRWSSDACQALAAAVATFVIGFVARTLMGIAALTRATGALLEREEAHAT